MLVLCRYALPTFTRSANGRLAKPSPPAARFERLPAKRILTLQMHEPEPWLVEPVVSNYDFDNLRLADAPERVVQAEFELEALMLTGSAVEVVAKSGERVGPPRGLQLHLGTADEPHKVPFLLRDGLAMSC